MRITNAHSMSTNVLHDATRTAAEAHKLRVLIGRLRVRLEFKQAKIEAIKFEKARLRRCRFEFSSEGVDSATPAVLFEAISADTALEHPAAQDDTEPRAPRAKGQVAVQALTANLPRIEQHNDTLATHCICGQSLERIGQGVRTGILTAELSQFDQAERHRGPLPGLLRSGKKPVSAVDFERTKAESPATARVEGEKDIRASDRIAELESAMATMRIHSKQVEAAVEQERLRIARDIHDDLGSILTALKFELSGVFGCATASAQVPLKRRASTDLVESAMHSVRSLIAALHPFPVDRAGLWSALLWKAGELQKSSGIQCRVVMNDDLPEPSSEISNAAFRIVQEALTNVARHARAAVVEITVYFSAGRWTIEITDDGCGIEGGGAHVDTTHHGLTGMRERAQGVGGEVTIVGRANHGTTVRFSV